MNEFLNMGGYAQYVWPSYGITLAVLVWTWWSARRRHAMALRRAKARAAAADRTAAQAVAS